MKKTKLMLGNNIESLKKLPDNSVDSVVSDPPYGLSFMGKKWDYDVPSVELWKEVYRVLKPGGHVLSFGGTRTYHRMVVNIEDAGFEIRDQIMWLYGSGFPKSLNIGKAVDKLQGNEREGGEVKTRSINRNSYGSTDTRWDVEPSTGQSPYEGFGTNLKPANEPICVARKPLSEKSVAENVLKWGTGGINIDGCRVGSDSFTQRGAGSPGDVMNTGLKKDYIGDDYEGRFPANIILECICDEVIKGEKGEVKKSGYRVGGKSENSVGLNGVKNAPDNYGDKGDIHTNPMCPCYLMDEQSGVSKGTKTIIKGKKEQEIYGNGNGFPPIISERGHSDKGGASRFFYQAKVSKSERNMGLDVVEVSKNVRPQGESFGNGSAITDVVKGKGNTHPTVKPVALMSYLCRLVTPPNGIVLDPFMGSGSTGIAAQLEGFRFCGMELDEDYFKIAEARINDFEKYRKFIKK
jgi:site-specific DNA-methyltransferase (adenine-specific)